jgi:hypothetical protein
VTGGLGALYLRPRRPLRFGLLAVSLFAAPSLVMSQTSSTVPAAVAGFLGGVGLMVFNPLWETVLQREIPATALSRVSAYEWFGSYAAQPVGLTLAGPVAAHLGVRRTLLDAGLAHLLITSPRWPSAMCANSRRVTPEAVEKICGQRVDPAGLRSTRT